MEAERTSSEEAISPELQEKIDRIKDKIRTNVKESGLDFSRLDDGSGYSGTYHIGLINNKRDEREFHYDIGFDDININQARIQYSTRGDVQSAEAIKKAIEQFLESECHLFKNRNGTPLSTLSDKELDFFIRRELRLVEQKYPITKQDTDGFSFTKDEEKPEYIFTIAKTLPSGRNNSVKYVINIRPIGDIKRAHNQYIKIPAIINLSSGTGNVEEAKELEERIAKILHRYGIIEGEVKDTGMESDKVINKQWLDPDKIKITQESTRSGEVRQQIHLVSFSAENRYPRIRITLGHVSRGEAQALVKYLKYELIPAYMPGGEKSDDALTLKLIREKMQEKFPEILNRRKEKKEYSSDVRGIYSDGQQVARLMTPSWDMVTQVCQIRLNPALSDEFASTIGTNVNIPLNTADAELAQSRISALQSLSKVVMEDYFAAHPGVEIVTELRSKKVREKEKHLPAFKSKEPVEVTPEGKIFVETLIDEHLKPAYEQFNRYIYWKTETEKEEDGSYKITARVMRNAKAEEFPANDNIMGRKWEFRAKDEEAATEFAHMLEENLMRKQHLFSRERPVEQFGVSSMRLVTKKSLLDAMSASPQIEDLQENLTKLLKRPVQSPT